MKMVATEVNRKNLVIWPDKNDLKELNDLFLRAAITDKRLPKDSPRNITTAWLDMKKTWHDYGWDKSAKIKIKPSGEDLDNYDKALELGLKLPQPDREIIWVIAISLADQAHGTWKRTAKRYNVTRQTIYNRHRGALIKAYYIQKDV